MRRFLDADGNEWEAVALPHPVAHLKEGRMLAFRPPAGARDETGGDGPEGGTRIRESSILFNGQTTAENAIRTMSEKELRRRLRLSSEAGGHERAPLL